MTNRQPPRSSSLHGRPPAMIKQTQFAILVFCNVYFRLHYYFPLHRFVKRKTRIRAIGPDAGRPNIRGMRPLVHHGSKAHSRESLVSEGRACAGPTTASSSRSCPTIKSKTNLFVIHQNKHIRIFELAKIIRLDRWRHEKPTGSG